MSQSKHDSIQETEQDLNEVMDDLESSQQESPQEETEDAKQPADEDLGAENELSLEEQLEQAQAKAEENWNTVLRMKADLENQRRRNEKQVEDAHKYAVKKFIEELLPVADSMEMGMAAEGDVEQIREGVALTKKVFDNALEKFGLEVVDPLGEKFNPDLHQAMAMQPSDEYEEGHVSAVMQKGYTLNGRLVRPAMVMVVKN
jgi:molecular chaperone GrpE